MQSWLILTVAGLLEVCWASSLKATAGFTKPGPTMFFAVTLAGSMYLLAVASRNLPIGTAYAVWVGIGAAGTALAGIVFYGEALSPARGIFLLMLLAAIVGLKLTTPLND